jgi:hypothetical protein
MRKMVRVPLLLLALVVVLVAIEALLARVARDMSLLVTPAHGAALHGSATLIVRGGVQPAPVSDLLAPRGSAAVAPVCGPLAAIEEFVGQAWGEVRVLSLLSPRGTFVYAFVSRRSTWSLAEGRPGEVVCIVDQGVGWNGRVVFKQ